MSITELKEDKPKVPKSARKFHNTSALSTPIIDTDAINNATWLVYDRGENYVRYIQLGHGDTYHINTLRLEDIVTPGNVNEIVSGKTIGPTLDKLLNEGTLVLKDFGARFLSLANE